MTQDPKSCMYLLDTDECRIAKDITKGYKCNVDCPLLHRQPYDFDCPDYQPKTDNQ